MTDMVNVPPNRGVVVATIPAPTFATLIPVGEAPFFGDRLIAAAVLRQVSFSGFSNGLPGISAKAAAAREKAALARWGQA